MERKYFLPETVVSTEPEIAKTRKVKKKIVGKADSRIKAKKIVSALMIIFILAAGLMPVDRGNLIIYPWHQSMNQVIYIKTVGGGYYSIKAMHLGKYLHVKDGSVSIVNVHQWSGWDHTNSQCGLRFLKR